MSFAIIFHPFRRLSQQEIAVTTDLATAEAILEALETFLKLQEAEGRFYVAESWDSFRYMDLDGTFEIVEKEIPSEQ